MNPNITKEGIEVKPGQVWIDLDRRMDRLGGPRTVVVERVEDGRAYCRTKGNTVTKLLVKRMHKSSTGWRLKP